MVWSYTYNLHVLTKNYCFLFLWSDYFYHTQLATHLIVITDKCTISSLRQSKLFFAKRLVLISSTLKPYQRVLLDFLLLKL